MGGSFRCAVVVGVVVVIAVVVVALEGRGIRRVVVRDGVVLLVTALLFLQLRS